MNIILFGVTLFALAVLFLVLAATVKSDEEAAFDQQIENWYQQHPEQRPRKKKGVPLPPPAAPRGTRGNDVRKRHMP